MCVHYKPAEVYCVAISDNLCGHLFMFSAIHVDLQSKRQVWEVIENVKSERSVVSADGVHLLQFHFSSSSWSAHTQEHSAVHTHPSSTQHSMHTHPSSTQHSMHTHPSSTQHSMHTHQSSTQHNMHTSPSSTQHSMHTHSSNTQHSMRTHPSSTQHSMHTHPSI